METNLERRVAALESQNKILRAAMFGFVAVCCLGVAGGAGAVQKLQSFDSLTVGTLVVRDLLLADKPHSAETKSSGHLGFDKNANPQLSLSAGGRNAILITAVENGSDISVSNGNGNEVAIGVTRESAQASVKDGAACALMMARPTDAMILAMDSKKQPRWLSGYDVKPDTGIAIIRDDGNRRTWQAGK